MSRIVVPCARPKTVDVAADLSTTGAANVDVGGGKFVAIIGDFDGLYTASVPGAWLPAQPYSVERLATLPLKKDCGPTSRGGKLWAKRSTYGRGEATFAPFDTEEEAFEFLAQRGGRITAKQAKSLVLPVQTRVEAYSMVGSPAVNAASLACPTGYNMMFQSLTASVSNSDGDMLFALNMRNAGDVITINIDQAITLGSTGTNEHYQWDTPVLVPEGWTIYLDRLGAATPGGEISITLNGLAYPIA